MMAVTGARVFDFHACVGTGGFGEVYRATLRSAGGLEREVAVKTLRMSVAPGDDAMRRLRDEARLLARLEHRAILDVIDIVQLGGRVAVVMKYLDGQDLGGCLEGQDPMPRRAAVEMIGEVASALAAAADHLELVHRDVKPSNVRILSDGSVKLLDFGIARSPQVEREGHTSTGMIVGTPGYLAPERVAEAVDGTASDVYSLGCVMYAALARRPLFYRVPRPKRLGMALNQSEHDAFIVEALQQLSPGPEIHLLRRMLAFEPHLRPRASSVEERCEDLAPHISGESLRRWARHRKWPGPVSVDGSLVGQRLTEELVEGPVEAPVRSSLREPASMERQRTPAQAMVSMEPTTELPRTVSPVSRRSGPVRTLTRPADSRTPSRVLPARTLPRDADKPRRGGSPMAALAFVLLVAGLFLFLVSEGLLGIELEQKVHRVKAQVSGLLEGSPRESGR